jgi:hypothetical protein
VAGGLAPDLEQVLRSRPELIGEMARGLATRSFAPEQTEDVMEAVGLLDAPAARPSDPPTRPIRADRARNRRGAVALIDYPKLTVSRAREQFRVLALRRPVAEGARQADFMPVETLLCLAASFRVTTADMAEVARGSLETP